MDELEKIKNKLKKKFEKNAEIDEGSDLPVHEKFTKEEDILKIKKKKANKFN